ncbi:MAG: Crp/Fnr family transcriptional regulator [Chitinophagaceae bacterium]|nr:MAG: Crp/Fnr family transcriptional regulator [Chitinophagaceae bacterium]
MAKKATGTRKHVWKTPHGHSPLSVLFNSIHPVSREAIACIDEQTYPIQVARGKFLVKPDNDVPHLYLILKGVIRAFIKEDGKEITTWINEENEIVTSIRNLGLNVPSPEYLQAIENTSLIAMPYSLVEFLYENFPESNIVGRKILEDNYRGAEERAYICRIASAEKKYQHLIKTRPGLVNRISLKYIASYLNMTIETLSRVRGRLAE